MKYVLRAAVLYCAAMTPVYAWQHSWAWCSFTAAATILGGLAWQGENRAD